MFRYSLWIAVAVVLGGVATAHGGALAIAQTEPPANCEVVADNLLNPRFVAVAEDGTLYVSEAGTGGDEPFFGEAAATPEARAGGATPEPQPLGTRGLTGRVSAIAPDGTQSVLVDGLASYGPAAEPVGPAGIAVADGTIWLAIGGAEAARTPLEPLPHENHLVAIDPRSGAVTPVADIAAYERANNPDPHLVDSNLYGLAVAPDGAIVVADAAGNAVYRVDPTSGAVAVAAVLPGLPLPEGMAMPSGGNPERGGANELDPVPTGVAIGPDGAVAVGLLSGGPFPPGAAKVVRLGADGTLADAATGLTMVVGVAVGPDGALYASQFSTNFLAGPPDPGNVVRIGPDGSSEVVVDGLSFPNGIAFDAAGNLYVVADSVNLGPGGAEPQGQVLRCAPDTAATPAPGGADDQAATEVSVRLVDFAFVPSELTIPADTEVTIRLTNEGSAPHNFFIDPLDVRSETIGGGQETTVTIRAAAGDYEYFCAIPGHRPAGMVGTLHVVAQ
jgi:plastocyanin/sugar lactone lactonase YvrE